MGVAIDWGSGTLTLNLCVRRKVGKRKRKEIHKGIIKKFNQWDHVWTPREFGIVEAHRQRCRRHTWDGLRYWRTGLVGLLVGCYSGQELVGLSGGEDTQIAYRHRWGTEWTIHRRVDRWTRQGRESRRQGTKTQPVRRPLATGQTPGAWSSCPGGGCSVGCVGCCCSRMSVECPHIRHL